MKKRLHIVALATAALLAVGATSVAAMTGALPLRSSARSTVTPPPKTKRVAQPQAAKVKSLQKALAAAKAKVKARRNALAKAKTRAQRKARAKALAQAKARTKALEKALAKAKKAACGTGYRYVNGKCLRV
jgi:colicin import membrane protein